MGTTPIQFELEAEVNGKQFLMMGEGDGNPREGRTSLSVEVDADHPEGFDPVSCPLICHQQTSLSCAESQDAGADIVGIAGGEYAVSPDRTGIIRDSQGEKVAHLEVRGDVTREDGTIVSKQTMQGTTQLPELTGAVTPVRDHILPSGPGEATGLTRYELETVDGERLEGITVVPYRWDNERTLDAPIVREVDVDTTWDGRFLDVDYQISMASMEGGVEIAPAMTQAAPMPSDD